MPNILIIKHGSLGDIAQASGAIQDISESHKEDQIHLLTTKPYFELFKKNPLIKKVILETDFVALLRDKLPRSTTPFFKKNMGKKRSFHSLL